ncbi:MAG: amidase family protein, partial [Candidatus Binataceae bacterium]
ALSGDANGLRIGIVREGFGWEGQSQHDVDDAVMEAAHAFEKIGAGIEKISIPWHRDGVNLWNAICLEGATALAMDGHAVGSNWKGYYSTSLLDAFSDGMAKRANDLPINVKLILMAGRYVREAYHGRFYAHARNLTRSLSAAYENAFQTHDLLLMPTTVTKAARIPPADAPMDEYLARAYDGVVNTCPFNLTGHPAINVPCAISEGLPVGMMLVGRIGEETTVLRAADAFERNIFAAPRPPAKAAAPSH